MSIGSKTFPPTGTKTRADDFLRLVGGCAANAAVAIHRLGGRARLAAPLGGPAGPRPDRRQHPGAAWRRGSRCLAGVVRVDGAISSLSSILIDARWRTADRELPRSERSTPARPRESAARWSRAPMRVLIDNRFPRIRAADRACRRGAGHDRGARWRPADRLTDELLTAATHIVFSADGLRADRGHDDLAAALRERRAHAPMPSSPSPTGPNDMLWLEAGKLRAHADLSRRRPSTRSPPATSSTAPSRWRWPKARTSRPPCASRPPSPRSNAPDSAAVAGAPSRAEVEEFLSRWPHWPKIRLSIRIIFYI